MPIRPSLPVSPLGPLIAVVQFGSVTVTLVNVTFPVFVTVNVYGRSEERRVGTVVVDEFATFHAAFWVIAMLWISVSSALPAASAVPVLFRSPSPPPFVLITHCVAVWLPE